MRVSRGVLAAAVAVFALRPVPAIAQFTLLPNGVVEYHTDLTVGGTFLCGGGLFTSGSCAATGNSLLLTNQGNTLALTFAGRSGPITAANVRTFFDAGSLIADFTGTGPFFFPTVLGVAPMFRLALSFASTQPTGTVTHFMDFYSNGTSQILAQCCEGASEFILGTVPQPGFRYGAIVYGDISPVNLTGQDQALRLQASVGLVPEPSAFLLLATGLLGVGAARRRQKISR